jgi:hypothetical protein
LLTKASRLLQWEMSRTDKARIWSIPRGSSATSTKKHRAASRGLMLQWQGKLSLLHNPVLINAQFNLFIRDGGLYTRLAFVGSCLSLFGERLEQVEKVRARISLRLIRSFIAVVAHRALAPRFSYSSRDSRNLKPLLCHRCPKPHTNT